MPPRHVTKLGLIAKKREYVSLKFKIVFPSYLGAMKTKTLVCFISTKNISVLTPQNTYMFCRDKTRSHFVKLKCAHVLIKRKFT